MLEKTKLFDAILTERDRRVAAGEDVDPVCVVASMIESGESVSFGLAQFVWEAHNEGPWRVRTEAELTLFEGLCEKAVSPLTYTEPETCEGVRVYRNDFGDCVLQESARGFQFAVWTRKGRVCIGFKDGELASDFRRMREEYSLEATGNRRVRMVVLEGMESPFWIQRVCADLATL